MLTPCFSLCLETRAQRHKSFKQMSLQGERGLSQYSFWDSVSCTHIYYVAKSDLEFLIFLPPVPECWDYSMQGFIWYMCCYEWIPGFYACKANTLLTAPPQLFFLLRKLYVPSILTFWVQNSSHCLLRQLEKVSYPDPQSSPLKCGECPPTSWDDYLGSLLRPSTYWHMREL